MIATALTTREPHITLLTEAHVLRLLTTSSGREVNGIETQVDGKTGVLKGDIIVVSCGVINSAALLLRSANDKHRLGLANSSDQVGRNYMYHLLGFMVALAKEPKPTTCWNGWFDKNRRNLHFRKKDTE